MGRRGLFVALIVVVFAAAIVALIVKEFREAAGPPVGGPPADPDAFVLWSPAFEHGEAVPRDYTEDGADLSPPLEWDNAPGGAAAFALLVEDPDAPVGSFTHWMMCEIPATLTGLPAGIGHGEDASAVPGAVQGVNGFGNTGYNGPAPPPGKPHRYVFRLYALDEKLDITGGFTKNQFRAAVAGHVLEEAVLLGTYAR